MRCLHLWLCATAYALGIGAAHARCDLEPGPDDQFGTLFTDGDRVRQRIKDDIAPKVAGDQAYQNAKKNTPNTARIEHDKALERVVVSLLKDDTELFKQFMDNESFRRWMTDTIFGLTYVRAH